MYTVDQKCGSIHMTVTLANLKRINVWHIFAFTSGYGSTESINIGHDLMQSCGHM